MYEIIVRAGWNVYTQIHEEVTFTKGRIIIKGSNISRGESRRADYISYYKLNIPIAVIEAKDNNHIIGDGMQQALDYAEMLDVPFVYSTNQREVDTGGCGEDAGGVTGKGFK